MLENVLLIWLAAFPLMGSPGPATISLAGIGTSYGFRSGIWYLIGIILGTFCVLIMVATGVTAIVLAKPTLVNVLTIFAAIYIMYLAWKIATAPIGIKVVSEKVAPSLISGLLLAIANPKAFAAIGAVYSGHTIVETNIVSDSVAKITALTVVIVLVNSIWLAFGATFSSILNNPTIGRIANIVFALMLIASMAFALINL